MNAASVLPDPVGAARSTFCPAAIAGHASACAGVGAANWRSNQAATAGWNKVFAVMIKRAAAEAPLLRPCGTAQDGRQVLRSYGVLCCEFKARGARAARCAGGAETPEKLTTLKAAVRHRAYFPRRALNRSRSTRRSPQVGSSE